MLLDINGQLVAERQRSIRDEAARHGLAPRDVAGRTTGARWFDALRTAALVHVRQIGPADAGLLRDGFARLSLESRRLRFFVSKKGLSERELSYFTDVDHHDHEALVAVSRFGGKGVAVARYIRDKQDRESAEVAVTVVDDWQGHGLGTMLTRRLAVRARREGIHRFTAMVLEENSGATRLLPKVGPTRLTNRDHGTLEFEVVLPPAGAERRALRWYQLAPAADPCRGM